MGQSQRLIGFAGALDPAATGMPAPTSATAATRPKSARLAVRPPTAPTFVAT
jgi:hypothetical protein